MKGFKEYFSPVSIFKITVKEMGTTFETTIFAE